MLKFIGHFDLNLADVGSEKIHRLLFSRLAVINRFPVVSCCIDKDGFSGHGDALRVAILAGALFSYVKLSLPIVRRYQTRKRRTFPQVVRTEYIASLFTERPGKFERFSVSATAVVIRCSLLNSSVGLFDRQVGGFCCTRTVVSASTLCGIRNCKRQCTCQRKKDYNAKHLETENSDRGD